MNEDLVTDHPFEPATFRDAFPGICGHLVDGRPCGYTEAEHADQGADRRHVPESA